MRMRGTAEERSASIIPDGIAECTSGYLTKQGGKYKSWRKRYFVLTGLKLRWYEKKEAFDAHGLHAARGEITCFAVMQVGAGKTCIRDARGGRDLMIRSELGDVKLLETIRTRLAPVEGIEPAVPLQRMMESHGGLIR